MYCLVYFQVESTRISVGLSQATLRQYLTAASQFKKFCRKVKWKKIDDCIIRYVLTFPLPRQRTIIEKLLAALSHLSPKKVRNIPVARRYLAQLRRQCPSSTKPPMIKDVVTALAWRLLHEGFPTTAVGVLLQFDCYLRPAELCSLKVENIAFARGRILGSAIKQTLLLLPRTKTGPLQSVDVSEPRLVRVLRRLVKRKECSARLFPSYSVFAKRFKNALSQMGLGHLGYTPHSLRHGAATTDLINKGAGDLKSIMYRGRWVSNAGRTYLQKGAAALLSAILPRSITRSFPRIDRRLYRLLLRTTFVPTI